MVNTVNPSTREGSKLNYRIEKGIYKSEKEATRETDFVDNYCYHANIRGFLNLS